MGDLKGFILAGHSFGGYACGLYATRYHQHIKKLLMLSPAGVPTKPENFNFDEEIEKFPKERRLPKFVYKLSRHVWKKKLSPFDIMRKCGRLFVKSMLKAFVKKRLSNDKIAPIEIEDYKIYLH